MGGFIVSQATAAKTTRRRPRALCVLPIPEGLRVLPSVPASVQGNGLRRVIRDAEPPEPPPQKSRGDGSNAPDAGANNRAALRAF